MSTHTVQPKRATQIRLWPGVAAAALLVICRFALPAVAPKAELFGVGMALIGVFSGIIFAAVILVWFLFFSRVRWTERLLAIAAMALAIVIIQPLTHISIQNGLMNMMFYIFAAPPTLALALVAWAAFSRRLSVSMQRVSLVVAMVLGCAVWTLARTNGVVGGMPDVVWRWTPTAEELLLATEPISPPPPSPSVEVAKPTVSEATKPVPEAPTSPVGPAIPPTRVNPSTSSGSSRAEARDEWPGFRGPDRDGVIRGVSLKTDWATSPPIEMWRRPIGPGWSSFAVAGDLLYTQEQRGDDEIVACYRVSTGEPVWRHKDAARFWESNGGAGPRATPTISNGRIYSVGATGLLNALDARTGARLWSRNVITDTNKKLPDWGLASSPLVIDDAVIVAVAGQLAAYDAVTGAPRWTGEPGGAGYSSPHLVTLDGVPQVLLMRGARTISVNPSDGKLLWEHTSGPPATSIVQPAGLSDGVLIAPSDAMGGNGILRLAVAREAGDWAVKERWTSRGLKPYFNDFVVHKGHAYGFDGSILSSIDLEDGTRKWKGGRYGEGQLVLLADQDLLLVISDDGELALVSATPDKFTEIARFRVLDAKTWNHPVLIGDVLLVRNGEQMAAFRMPVEPPSRQTR